MRCSNKVKLQVKDHDAEICVVRRTALQNRGEESLRERAAIAPHSPVPLLDGLLASHREVTPSPTMGALRS
jgi:hypothetical protein